MLTIARPGILCCLMTLQLCFLACGPSKSIIATRNIPYQSTPITIDGNAIDWKNIAFNFEPNTTLHYAITNDTANLYVCITSTSPGLEKKMFRMGMKVFFDTSGERKEVCGIQFPMPVDDNAFKLVAAAGNGREKNSDDEYRKFIKLQENQYETFGFPGGGNGLNAIGSQDYVTIGFNVDQEDILVYEIKIPLKNIYGGAVPPAAFHRDMTVGIHIEGVPRSEDPNAPVASEVGQPGANMSGAKYNLGRGGGFERNNTGYSDQTLYKDQRVWFRFTLATH